MTCWWWVRHGPTHETRMTGWRDVPADLSDKAAIERLRAVLPGQAVLISSDLLRARQTLAALRPQEPSITEPALREINFGLWDGRSFDEIAASDPELSRRFWENPGEVAPPKGESWNQTAARVNGVVDRLSRAHPDGHIIAVAHFGVILTQVQRARGVTAYEALSQHIDPLSVTRIQITGRTAELQQVNHRP